MTHQLVRIYKFPEKKLYTKVANYTARDPRISFGAKGLLTYLLSFPEDFIVFKKNIIKTQRVTRTFLDNYFNELQEFGYIAVREQLNKNGKFASLDYIVYSVPFNESIRVHQEPYQYPEKEVVPMQPDYIGQNVEKTQVSAKKPDNSGELTDAARLHRPMQDSSTESPLTPYKDLKEIDSNKGSVAKQALAVIDRIREKFEPGKKYIPLRETENRITLIRKREKDFKKSFGADKDFIEGITWVFSFMAKKWINTDYWIYFTPETLFRASNFIRYCEDCKNSGGTPPPKRIEKKDPTATSTVASSPQSYHNPKPTTP